MNMGMFQAITDIVLHGNFFINVFNQNKHNLTKPNLTYPSLKVSKQNNFQKIQLTKICPYEKLSGYDEQVNDIKWSFL